jgi:hypothetical protein
MKVEIINHDLLSITMDMDYIPRIGETILLATNDNSVVNGVVDDIEHWLFEGGSNYTQVTIYLRPKDID